MDGHGIGMYGAIRGTGSQYAELMLGPAVDERTFNGRMLMRRAKDRNGKICVIISGVGYGDGIESLNDCDEMWIGDVTMRPVRKLKELRRLSGSPNATSVHDFLKGMNNREGDWLKEEKDGEDVPNEDYNGLGC